MATWFEITYTGEPTEADWARVAELAAQGYTSGQLLNDESPALDSSRKWFVWSQDERSGRWMVVNEGFEPHCREYAERCMKAAAKHGMTVNYVAFPEGEEPR